MKRSLNNSNLNLLVKMKDQLTSNLDVLAAHGVCVSALPKGDALTHFAEAFYGANIEKQCIAQAKLFLKQPSHLSLHYKSNHQSDYIHQYFINDMNQHAQSLGWRKNSKPQRGTLIMLGVGAGYQLPWLLKQIRYTDVILVEPEPRHLALLCQHIDLAQISALCDKRGGSFSLATCESFDAFYAMLQNRLVEVGPHLVADISLYRHYSTPVFDDIFERFRQWRNSLASMWGFLEDELIGLAHTQQNSASYDIASHQNRFASYADVPVAVIGSGPSLDKDIALLKRQRDKVLLVSCGTALSVLLSHDIVPDFQVEMERSPQVFYLKEEQLTDPRLHSTVLLTLNTVYPKLLNTYRHCIVFPKAHDLGATLLSEHRERGPALAHCNPTVTNMAVAALSRLGFNNLLLLGCDYGYLDPKRHHSQDSTYYDPSCAIADGNYGSEIRVKGNFTKHVFTSRIFNESRLVQERLLSSKTALRVLNCSDGAFVKGSVPTQFSDVTLCEVDKNQLMNEVRRYAKTQDVDTLETGHYVTQAIVQLETLRLRVANRTQPEAILVDMARMIRTLETDPDFVFSRYLLAGSMKYLTTSIASHINHIAVAAKADYTAVMKEKLLHTLGHTIDRLQTLTQPNNH
ncbi:hypothetical protein C3B51_23105 [Pseudoalteromonas rubra]|uniref:DUF115 domain-containing protein n=2 Tax=Pseudoalteromonas rubra TaxID=43658 RepID=A0A4Q7DY10_9GAMM|nr:6-hydroxymethylpterin diphosphokinase MptE-like protein [Pseudoalteromonas rubra]RZM70305.1 hypothetical protein C3B51_23105 [Pseudoalteromonas rubra]